jgi:hypothetical protein
MKKKAGKAGAKTKPKTDPLKSVFINCPFDDDFEPLFEAIIFAIACCGFDPRSALESGTVADSRLDRITQALFSSKYSIHDLSRCKGEGDERLARFNMPLELGIAIARRYISRGEPDEHNWLLLVPQGHQYMTFISDLAGFDPKPHDGTVEAIVRAVVTWLVTQNEGISMRTPKQVLDALPAFQAEIIQLKDHWGAEPPWGYVVEAAKKTTPKIYLYHL